MVVLSAVRVGLAQEAAADVVVPVGVISLAVVEILQGSAVAPIETGGAVEWINGGDALAEGVVAEKGPAVFPVLVVGEIEDFAAIGTLVGELFLGEVRIGDEGRAVELVVIVGGVTSPAEPPGISQRVGSRGKSSVPSSTPSPSLSGNKGFVPLPISAAFKIPSPSVSFEVGLIPTKMAIRSLIPSPLVSVINRCE